MHWKELKQRHCILTDATGVKVLVEGLAQAWHAIFDVFNGDETAVFTFALTKHGDELNPDPNPDPNVDPDPNPAPTETTLSLGDDDSATRARARPDKRGHSGRFMCASYCL